MDEWPASRLWGRVQALPEDSAYARAVLEGHTSIHEVLAQIRDAVVTTAHGYRLDGKPKNYPRPGGSAPEKDAVDLTNPADVGAIVRFFGRPI